MISNILRILSLQPRIQFFLIVGQDIFGNKIPGIISRPACHICFIISFLSRTSDIRTIIITVLKNFFGMLFKLGSGILDVLKEFRLLEHTATHYLLTRDFIIGKKAHDCKLTMPLLLLLCLLPKSLDISCMVRYISLKPMHFVNSI